MHKYEQVTLRSGYVIALCKCGWKGSGTGYQSSYPTKNAARAAYARHKEESNANK